MNVILTDSHVRTSLLPLTFLRPLSSCRLGIHTIEEKWVRLGASVSWDTISYLQTQYPPKFEEDNFVVSGNIVPNVSFLNELKTLNRGEVLTKNGQFVAGRISKDDSLASLTSKDLIANESKTSFLRICSLIDLFTHNASEIINDLKLISATKVQEDKFPKMSCNYLGHHGVFAPQEFNAFDVTFNTSEGPIYIGKNVQIMEGVKLRGPLAIGDHSVVKMGAKIYGGTTIGPHCKVGGEISNVVFQSYSNKGHDGFLGNSVIGEWCNIGADTNSSNLKNNYEEVKLWNYNTARFEKTGKQFCGLIMGDHSKCGINTMFNTGTVVGVGANIFGSGFPRNFIPSFAWGGAHGFSSFQLKKFFQTAEAMMKRRDKFLSSEEKEIVSFVFKETNQFRYWEK